MRRHRAGTRGGALAARCLALALLLPLAAGAIAGAAPFGQPITGMIGEPIVEPIREPAGQPIGEPAGGSAGSPAGQPGITPPGERVGQLTRRALAGGLEQSPVWAALLHASDGRPRIRDSGFLLSLPAFSPRDELVRTIEALYGDDPGAVCRFPARHAWLRSVLDAPALPLGHCPDIAEFRERAPIDEIALVYASENLAQPASIHGHAFLKIAGRTRDGHRAEHAISFYTDADDPNLPRLLFESLVTGKPGYFSLTPYAERLAAYVDDEQRTVWEYRLALDATQRDLVGLHLLELRQARLSYFFQDYNCATVVRFILGLTGRTAASEDWWITPRDLVRHARTLDLVADTRVVAPNRWLIRTLQRELPPEHRSALRARIEAGEPDLPDPGPGEAGTDTALGNAATGPGAQAGAHADAADSADSARAFIGLRFAIAYNHFAYHEGRIDRARWADNDRRLQAHEAARFAGRALASDRRGDPVDRPGDSQLAAGLLARAGRVALTLSWLPTSHTIDDDNRAAGTETELRLLSGTVRLPLDHGLPRVERFDLYGIRSMLPRDPSTGGLSGRFSIAYEPHRDRRLDVRHALAVEGALGATIRPLDDVDLFALAGAGIASTTNGSGYVYPRVEAGAVVREVWSMKSRVLVARTWHQVDPGARHDTVALHQVRHIDAGRSIHVEIVRDFGRVSARTTWNLAIKRVF